MTREKLYEHVKRLEGDKGFTPEGAALRMFIRQNTEKVKIAALFLPPVKKEDNE